MGGEIQSITRKIYLKLRLSSLNRTSLFRSNFDTFQRPDIRRNLSGLDCTFWVRQIELILEWGGVGEFDLCDFTVHFTATVCGAVGTGGV